jgi:hypothetical protein
VTSTLSGAAAAPHLARQRGPISLPVALLMPVGPLAIALLRFLLPYYTASTNTAMAADVASAQGRESAVLWLGYIGMLTLVPGVLALAHLTRAAAPRLTAWGTGLAVAGYLSLGGLLASDHILWSGASAHAGTSTTTAFLDHAHPTIGIQLGVFVVGHVIGTVLLGIALYRSGRVPSWAGIALAVSQPLHFVATVILGSNVVDLIAWLLTAIAMAVAAKALLAEKVDTSG